MQIPYDGSKHDDSSACHSAREQREIRTRGLIAVSPPAFTSFGHTNRVGTIAVCKILGLAYELVLSKARPNNTRPKPWVCVTPEVEATLRVVNKVAHCTMLVIPEAARRLVDKRDLLIEYDTMQRLGADDAALFDVLALAGIMGDRAQFEAQCTQRNPKRSDLSIRRAWEKFRRRRIIHAKLVRAGDEYRARNLKTKR